MELHGAVGLKAQRRQDPSPRAGENPLSGRMGDKSQAAC